MSKKEDAQSLSAETQNLSTVLDILRFYQNDWEYRNKQFWSLLLKMFIANILITILPFITSISGVSFDVSRLDGSLFPFVGLLMTVFSVLILSGEAKRISYISATRNRIILTCFPSEYRFIEFADSTSPSGKSRMIYWVVIYFGLFQLAVEIATLFFLISK